MSFSWQQIKQRKLVQWSAAYLAGAWLQLQVIAPLADALGWGSVVVRIATVLLGIFLCAVVIIAWHHGERGTQRLKRIEILLPAGLLVIAGAAITSSESSCSLVAWAFWNA